VIALIKGESTVNKSRLSIVVLLLLATMLLAGSARPATKATALTGTVGPGFTISLKDQNGKGVVQLDPGDYTITVTDNSDDHDFHLFGPGVDKSSNIDNTVAGQPEKFVWDVTLTNGVYRYHCDAHPGQMKGSFRAGPAPPPPPKLTAKVGPGKTISLKKGGVAVKSLVAGTYKVVVKDATKKDNFHLVGPGVNKKTGVRGLASVTWTVKFSIGKGSYRSDASKKLKRAFKVIAAPPTPTP
jgi:plastocyanin